MNKAELFEIVGKVEMAPLIDQEENPGVQIGWYKMCKEPIPVLDELMKDSGQSTPGYSITVERRQVASLYQYIVYCPLSWLI